MEQYSSQAAMASPILDVLFAQVSAVTTRNTFAQIYFSSETLPLVCPGLNTESEGKSNSPHYALRRSCPWFMSNSLRIQHMHFPVKWIRRENTVHFRVIYGNVQRRRKPC